jgi:hypothetical protein
VQIDLGSGIGGLGIQSSMAQKWKKRERREAVTIASRGPKKLRNLPYLSS